MVEVEVVLGFQYVEENASYNKILTEIERNLNSDPRHAFIKELGSNCTYAIYFDKVKHTIKNSFVSPPYILECVEYRVKYFFSDPVDAVTFELMR